MSAEHRVSIKIDPKPNTAAGWLVKSKSVNTTANANAATFVSIAALLAQLGTDCGLLDTAETKAANRGKVEIAARNAQWLLLQKSFRAFVGGVQGLCDAAPDADHAKSIAGKAGLDAKVPIVRVTAELRGKALGNGEVALYGRRPLKRSGAFFEWVMSTDGGKTWTSIPTTNTAKTQVPGLTPATTVSFRYRTTLKNVTSEWTQMVAVAVR